MEAPTENGSTVQKDEFGRDIAPQNLPQETEDSHPQAQQTDISPPPTEATTETTTQAPSDSTTQPQTDVAAGTDPEPVKQEEISHERHLIDAFLSIKYVETLSPEQSKAAMNIARSISALNDKYNRKSSADIESIAARLHNEYAEHSSIIEHLFLESISRMSPQIEIIVAYICHYSVKYNPEILTNLLTKLIPEAIQNAIQSDMYTTLKLLLRAVSSFAAYNFITAESLNSLLVSLIPDDTATPTREHALLRALLVTVKINNPKITPETIEKISQKVQKHIETHQFSELKPMPESLPLLTLLSNSDPLLSVHDPYFALFAETPQTPIDFPSVTFTFSEIDRSPFPFMVFSPERAKSDVKPILADITSDILVLYGQDRNLTCDQLLALNMILKQRSCNYDDVSTLHSNFLLQIEVVIILSDLLQLPKPVHQPIFHVSVITKLFQYKYTHVPYLYSEEVNMLVEQIARLDIGCYHRFVSFFCHQLSQFDFSWPWAKWEKFIPLQPSDPRTIFISNICLEMRSYNNPQVIFNNVLQTFHSLIPRDTDNVKVFEDGTGFEGLASSIRDVMNGSDLDQVVAKYEEIAGRVREYAALQIFITAIFYPSKGSCEVVFLEIAKFEQIVRRLFSEEWKQSIIVDSAAVYFKDQPTVMRQILLNLILKGFISTRTFIQWFFNANQTDNLAKPMLWSVWRDVMTGLITVYRVESKEEDTKDLIIKMYKSACELFNNVELNSVGEWFFVGNMVDFGRSNLLVWREVRDKIREECNTPTTKKAFTEILDRIDAVMAI